MAMRTSCEIRIGSRWMDSISRNKSFHVLKRGLPVAGLQRGVSVEGQILDSAFDPRQMRQQHAGPGIVVDPEPGLGAGGSRDQKLAVRLEPAQGQQDIGRGRLRLFGDGKVIGR